MRKIVIAVVFGLVGATLLAQDVVDVDQDGVFPGSGAATLIPERGHGEGVAATLLGVGWTLCPVGTIDTATGAWTFIANAGFDRCNSMARDSSGVFYTVAQAASLITIDTATGAGTQVATLNPAVDDAIRGLAFSPSDVLYAVVNGVNGNPNDELWTIDTATGAMTLVGDMGFDSVQSLAFHPLTGTLYATDNLEGLLTVDPATGAATDVDPTVDGSGDVQTISVLPGGTIFALRYDLYTLDPATGESTLVALGDYPDLRGADFTGPIPVELMGFSID